MQYRRCGDIERVANMPVESQGCDGGKTARDKRALEGEEREEGGEVEFIGRV